MPVTVADLHRLDVNAPPCVPGVYQVVAKTMDHSVRPVRCYFNFLSDYNRVEIEIEDF